MTFRHHITIKYHALINPDPKKTTKKTSMNSTNSFEHQKQTNNTNKQTNKKRQYSHIGTSCTLFKLPVPLLYSGESGADLAK